MSIKVIYDNTKKIYGLSEEEAEKIKEDLTVENPAYLNAMKFSKYQNTKIPKYLFYYTQESGYLTVPSGYTIPFDNLTIEDNREEKTVKYPPFLVTLRKTQDEAFRAYIEDTDKGIIVLPTGKGKSILGLNIAYRLRQKTLVIVHKDDLADGWKEDAKLCFGDALTTGLLKAKKKIVGEQITIAMIQTLNKMSKEELEKLYNQFGCIIVDEMHHISSASFDLLHKFNCPYKIGLSATPERADGLSEAMFFHLGQICYSFEATTGDEDILDVVVNIKRSAVTYMPHFIKKNRRWVSPTKEELNQKLATPIFEIPYKERPRVDYHTIDSKVVLFDSYMLEVCSDVSKEYIQGRSCILFFSQKEHIRIYYDYMIENGLNPEHIQMYYGDAKESKEEMKRKAESKEVYITLATYSIATEGTNVKAWEVCFLVSSINNEKNTEQAVGRIRRSKEGKINPVIVYDYTHPLAWVVSNHILKRKKRYKKLHFTIKEDKPKGIFFSKGGRRNGI